MLSWVRTIPRWQYSVITFALVALGVGAMSLSARAVIPLEPVPVSLQVMVALMIGLALGPRLGALSVAGYVALGLAGAPVFAHAPYAGPAVLVGPSGGYLPGMVAAALLVGLTMGKSTHRLRALVGCLLGVSAIYFCGASWLAVWLAAVKGSTLYEALAGAWSLGMKPFVVFEVLKVIVAAGLAPALIKGVNRLQQRSLLP